MISRFLNTFFSGRIGLINAILLVPVLLTAQPKPTHNLHFEKLAKSWDEGLPLGNGTVGALVWEKEGKLRLSLDRADVWDMRPMAGLHREEFSFKWVQEQVRKKDYKPVQQYLDAPYDREPAPSKIPAGALEFRMPEGVTVKKADLELADATAVVAWSNGMILKTFVHATRPVGWFRFEGVGSDFAPDLIAPQYEGKVDPGAKPNPVGGEDLARLGYKQGTIRRAAHSITYNQQGWGGFRYEITVRWKMVGKGIVEGVWSVSSHYPKAAAQPAAANVTQVALKESYDAAHAGHSAWWTKFWAQSTIQVPDPLIEKQWYLEQYKFGSAARRGAPPISLQAVWTADNGRIPPWKGDYHHDLNTQLSYWPAYSGNHLEEALGYLDHLDENKNNYLRYTQDYFGVGGLAVPGVTTLDGTEMGGWIQYSLSPTVSGWLAQHYYLQWRYGMDRKFLKDRAYPWFKQVCTFFENITIKNENGQRQLPISSSPEIHNNSLEAWFHQTTNYDLALIKFAFKAGAELAIAMGDHAQADQWQAILKEFPDYAKTTEHELMFAPGHPYNESHRHFSNVMAIHPLGLIKWEDGDEAQQTIRNTLAMLDKIGPDYWCGYSYSWLANLKARAKDGAGARDALSIFAKAFCLPNSFHANGDQTKSGLSKFTYRPFTLEGNFAFASGLQEMLLQSYAGFIQIMPALPADWQDAAFQNLRAEGAVLVSAKKKGGKIVTISLDAEKAGQISLELASESYDIALSKGTRKLSDDGKFVKFIFPAGGSALISLRQ
ncbi:glycoside hydrolase N-terminal domain-containing protein [Dyadobacter sp. CY261]|uniref:glycosyl hydrolase family 95 catalytic domain-containing protein n=1 Tax=Dyadobacter sp. CY261 TaxID=2907203 RepID=UPI001F259AAE|nr:glycoside hydrolase N-terminal domain-containing protein [Dyadobacter sp. CY261]MCF0074143.1 glycoside hydrolase N-terminal domain-containing protein [Dyadobacter sp. CY261]